jgi:hypothetical protein
MRAGTINQYIVSVTVDSVPLQTKKVSRTRLDPFSASAIYLDWTVIISQVVKLTTHTHPVPKV